MADISNMDDMIDARDIIARIEELEDLCEPEEDGTSMADDEDREELATLSGFLAQMKGYGGDEQWRGDWYPVTLIRDSYFEDYAQELAWDIGAVNSDAAWPANCIDWEAAARQLQMDYTSVEFDGVTYWYR